MDNSKYKYGSKVDYRDLSDVDFIKNLDALSSNYYSDYIRGRAVFTGSIDSFVSRTSVDGCKATPSPLLPPRTMDFIGYFKRRTFCLFLIALCAVIEIVYIVLSFVLPELLKDTLPFIGEGTMFSSVVLSFVNDVFSASSSAVSGELVLGYLLGGGLILYALFSLVTFIAALVALFSKRKKNGAYKRVYFGFLSIVRLVCMAIGIVYSFVLKTGVGYDVILLAVTPVITLICSALGYKKITVSVPETYLDVNGKIKEGYSPLDFIDR